MPCASAEITESPAFSPVAWPSTAHSIAIDGSFIVIYTNVSVTYTDEINDCTRVVSDTPPPPPPPLIEPLPPLFDASADALLPLCWRRRAGTMRRYSLLSVPDSGWSKPARSIA
jgi:hypothetical protein